MLWFKFFKSKIPQIGVFLLMSAIYIVTFWLWHLPMMAFVNSTLFAVIIFIIYLISSYFRWKANCEAIERVVKDNEELQKKLEFAGYVLSENTLISTQEGEREEIELTSSENKILTLLFRGNGEVVTKEKILQELWQTDEFIDANTLNVKMTRLRKKLGEIGFDKHIMTKRGSGYALV